MRTLLKMNALFLVSLMTLLLIGHTEAGGQSSKPRVIVMTDGEIDDRQ